MRPARPIARATWIQACRSRNCNRAATSMQWLARWTARPISQRRSESDFQNHPNSHRQTADDTFPIQIRKETGLDHPCACAGRMSAGLAAVPLCLALGDRNDVFELAAVSAAG